LIFLMLIVLFNEQVVEQELHAFENK
jgi:hypothetical protein